MKSLTAFNFRQWIDDNRDKLRPPVCNQQVFEDNDFIVMVVGGPNRRDDYHLDEGPEFFYQLEGEMLLRTVQDGERVDIPIGEGEILLLPPRVPHSPQRFADTVGLDICLHVAEILGAHFDTTIPERLQKLFGPDITYHINPTGKFVIGGPHGDTGLTGRKIVVDTYGGKGAHGGGAFSGKDASKVDRSAAYAARHAAKNLVAAGLARECEVQLSYAVGAADPVRLRVRSFGGSVYQREHERGE